MVYFCKQKTAYEMRISDWSSDVCSSDLEGRADGGAVHFRQAFDAHAQHLGLGGGVLDAAIEIGRASCRERVCQYVSISVVAVSLQNNKEADDTKRKRLHHITRRLNSADGYYIINILHKRLRYIRR